MPHPLDQHALPGIGPLRRARLLEAGLITLEDLLEAAPTELAALPGLSRSVVTRAQQAAQQIVMAPEPAPLPEVPELPGSQVPPQLREETTVPVRSTAKQAHRRGLEAARRIETTLDAVRRCRAHLKDVDGLPPVRKELKRLRKVLGRLQRECITHGLTSRALDDLERLLGKLDGRLDRFASREPTMKRAFKLLERVQTAERRLAARIG